MFSRDTARSRAGARIARIAQEPLRAVRNARRLIKKPMRASVSIRVRFATSVPTTVLLVLQKKLKQSNIKLKNLVKKLKYINTFAHRLV